MNGLPTWARVVAVVGLPGAIALIMLWLYVGALAETKRAALDALVEARGTLTRLREHDEQTAHMIPLLERICRRLGKTAFEREACD